MEQITESNKEKDAELNRRASLLSIILTSMSYKNIYRWMKLITSKASTVTYFKCACLLSSEACGTSTRSSGISGADSFTASVPSSDTLTSTIFVWVRPVLNSLVCSSYTIKNLKIWFTIYMMYTQYVQLTNTKHRNKRKRQECNRKLSSDILVYCLYNFLLYDPKDYCLVGCNAMQSNKKCTDVSRVLIIIIIILLPVSLG